MTNWKSLMFLCGLLALIHVGLGQVFSEGPCPTNLKVVEKFKMSHYEGLWFENQKYTSPYTEERKCTTYEHEIVGKNSLAIHQMQLSAKYRRVNHYANSTMVERAKFEMDFEGQPFFNGSQVWILAIDQSHYAVSYSCMNFDCSPTQLKIQYLWLLTRKREPEDRVIRDARKAIKKQGLTLVQLDKTNQRNCPKHPSEPIEVIKVGL